MLMIKKCKSVVKSYYLSTKLESKLDTTVLDPEIHIENDEIFCFDRNWHGGGTACYIKGDIC